jgi:hypothetical protein
VGFASALALLLTVFVFWHLAVHLQHGILLLSAELHSSLLMSASWDGLGLAPFLGFSLCWETVLLIID